MKSLAHKIILGVGLITSIASCKKDETLKVDNIVGLGGDTWIKGPIDDWIYSNFTKPYNIEVKYKWDRTELDIDKNVTPVLESQVIPVMETVRDTWTKPYTAIAGEGFVKKYGHKQFVLVGSPQYNSNGTITLGTAEGGRKVVLYVINYFEKSNTAEVKRMLHTIHHEFGHILNQNIAVTPDYKRITPDGYTSVWFNYTDAEALPMGFITSYARSNPEDDFVEMLATMLVEGKAGFEMMLNRAGVTGKPLLQQKQQIVTAYMKSAFGIDIGVLQDKTQEAIANLK